jgi:undecaprenyl diphosphate synthase
MQSPDRVPSKATATAIPAHVAIIMDGNGRWATTRGLPRVEGHRRGVEALRRTVKACGDLGIKYLTIYSFSAENWSRPAKEIDDLMALMKRFIRDDLNELHRNGVHIRVIGDRSGLDPEVAALIEQAEIMTRDNRKFSLCVAFNYGGRQEIARAARDLAVAAKAGRLDPKTINADLFEAQLDTAGMPDPDLIIRTSGEQRLSNFLLWQAAYAEFVFLPLYWPDFDRNALVLAIEEFRGRERRFGGVEAQTGS